MQISSALALAGEKKREGKKRVGALLWKILECQRRHSRRVSIGLKGKVLELNYVNKKEQDWLSFPPQHLVDWRKEMPCLQYPERGMV